MAVDAVLGIGSRLYYSADNVTYTELTDIVEIGPPDDPDRHRPLAWFHDVHACVDPDAGRTKEQPPRREIEVAPTRFPERNLGRLVDPVGDDQHQPVG